MKLVSGWKKSQYEFHLSSQRVRTPAFLPIEGVLDSARTAFLTGARCPDPGAFAQSCCTPVQHAVASRGKLAIR
jgi:hypothetical protein